MKSILALFFASALSLNAAYLWPNTNPPLNISFGWTASTSPGVVGYNIYWGVGSWQYTNLVNVGNSTVGTVSNLVRGATYYFACTAYDAIGLESTFSNEVSAKGDFLLPPSGFGKTNVVVSMTIESAPSPSGPWTRYATLATTSEPASPQLYFRSAVAIQPPSEAPPAPKPLFRSPKKTAS